MFGTELAKDLRHSQRLSDLTACFDAAISDAYNTEGYWDYLTVRGFVIDNRFNYRRDGLPINAETAIPLDNKARSRCSRAPAACRPAPVHPGGLVNFVVKRPNGPAAAPRRAGIGWRGRQRAPARST